MVDDAEVDGLYALPLDEFVAARDALAARLRKDGDRDAAARVKKLRKPSVAAWAVNQLAHQHPDPLARVIELREEIENASGSKAMRAASDERRRLIAELVRNAQTILDEGGHSATGDTIQAITQTLHAGDDEEEREALRRGRLARELEPAGLGGFGLSFDDAAEEESEDPELEEKSRRADALMREAEDADREAGAAERAVGEAERALESARTRAEAARRAAELALRRAERARRDIESRR